MPMWNSFPHVGLNDDMPRKECESMRHEGQGVPAQFLELLWDRDDSNIAISPIYNAWFACRKCHLLMLDLYHADALERRNETS
jgi:hypothetical protein